MPGKSGARRFSEQGMRLAFGGFLPRVAVWNCLKEPVFLLRRAVRSNNAIVT
jgi:hypothetical protein